jgi:hypothetical protein
MIVLESSRKLLRENDHPLPWQSGSQTYTVNTVCMKHDTVAAKINVISFDAIALAQHQH